MKLALAMVLLLGCASRVTVRRPADPSSLRAGEGRVAVTVRSREDALNVALVPRGTEAQQGMSVTPWCQTPCALYLTPGDYALYTGSPRVRDAVSPLRVASDPLAVTARAASRAGWERGRNLLVGGAGLVAVGGIFLAFSPLEVTGGSPTGVETIVVGAAVGALGAALIALGARLMSAESTGVEVAPEAR